MYRQLTAVFTLTAIALLGACADTETSDTEATAIKTTTTPVTSTTIPQSTCESVASTFREVASANTDLPDPTLAVTCEDNVAVVTSNGIPDYPYIETTPGIPTEQDLAFRIPLVPAEADEPGAIPLLGAVAVAINGVPIYGPTEGTGGDVLSLEDALSECGSHNGPTGFHIHIHGSADGTACLHSSEDVTSGTAMVGWSPDGYPIMSGVVCEDEACATTLQLHSGWELTDEALFASDTWSAHSYVEGSGDLDQCNGRVDADGQYRYYTTPTFPYILGCYRGVVADDALPGPGAR